MAAIAAVDTALWDIKAKAAGLPLYQLLGGKSRSGVMVYGHANGRDIPETLDAVARYLDKGYKAVRAQSGVPGLDHVYGVAHGKCPYEPAVQGLVEESIWSTEKYLDFAPKLFEAVRARFGFDFHLLHDVHHRLTPIEAARLGKSLEPYRLFWMEDPTPAENQESLRLIRQHTVTPIAIGEVFNSIHDCREILIENQLIDYIRTSVVHAGGITQLRKIAVLAELYQVRTGCHGATDLSPVCLGAALHFDLWVPNFGIQEYMAPQRQRPTRSSRTPTPSRTAISIPATCPATASTSTRRWRRNTRTSRPICRSPGSKTARCGAGRAASPLLKCEWPCAASPGSVARPPQQRAPQSPGPYTFTQPPPLALDFTRRLDELHARRGRPRPSGRSPPAPGRRRRRARRGWRGRPRYRCWRSLRDSLPDGPSGTRVTRAASAPAPAPPRVISLVGWPKGVNHR